MSSTSQRGIPKMREANLYFKILVISLVRKAQTHIETEINMVGVPRSSKCFNEYGLFKKHSPKDDFPQMVIQDLVGLTNLHLRR